MRDFARHCVQLVKLPLHQRTVSPGRYTYVHAAIIDSGGTPDVVIWNRTNRRLPDQFSSLGVERVDIDVAAANIENRGLSSVNRLGGDSRRARHPKGMRTAICRR